MKISDLMRKTANWIDYVKDPYSQHFGVCPSCYKSDGYRNIYKTHVFFYFSHVKQTVAFYCFCSNDLQFVRLGLLAEIENAKL